MLSTELEKVHKEYYVTDVMTFHKNSESIISMPFYSYIHICFLIVEADINLAFS
ncbi:hypothetical protein HanHA300_Chr05g0173071 [Helianthus annuus]|nr:hypothetical protein HanHA300_Chr05g0173071 [Helianthus annuus]KAJ0576703.1 hypothetical protein HanIR_Chr05g0227421 [Helianthus annuus]KAJ0584331.1 hypothetical protein HanHA89_Chr05g0187331 [Helianthus annuus]KAJ0746963.1 hypothetical protein HanOQP8_Chr05g0183941 [Helianthus annuus]KAJ0750017.1 hypothetical protein HanLR1_Chr05g0176951 [Helianthus annuus]